MARRTQHSAQDRFSTTEAAIGTGLSPRNVIYLCAAKLIPVVGGGRGRGKHRQLNYEGLARVAVIAAFFDAGIEIFLASRLVHEIGEEADFHTLANLDSFLAKPRSGIISRMREEGLDPDNALFLHDNLRRRSDNYRPGIAMQWDRLVEIFDRMYVYLNHLEPDEESGTVAPGTRPTALYRISGWKKGSRRIEIGHAPIHRHGELPPAWDSARRNFKGMIRINVSLAIRDALDAIATARAA